MIKKELDDFLSNFPQDLGSSSCEMVCKLILDRFNYLNYVRVMEDNENGSEAYRA
jgi:hypothetical protein